MEKHTPIPWEVAPEDKEKVRGPDGQGIAVMSGYLRTQTERDANTEFIVLAVNNYEQLLEACEALPDFDIENPDAADFKDHADDFIRAMRLARAVIAKLKHV